MKAYVGSLGLSLLLTKLFYKTLQGLTQNNSNLHIPFLSTIQSITPILRPLPAKSCKIEFSKSYIIQRTRPFEMQENPADTLPHIHSYGRVIFVNIQS